MNQLLILFALLVPTSPQTTARAAMAMVSVSPAPAPAITVPAVPPKAPVPVKRGKVTFVTADGNWCHYCNLAKAAIKGKTFDFDVVIVTSNEGYLPRFFTDNPVTGKASFTGWTSLDHLTATYNRGARIPYPLKQKNWTGPVTSRSDAIYHLLHDPEHRGHFTRAQLNPLTLPELQSLHSDDHTNSVQRTYLVP